MVGAHIIAPADSLAANAFPDFEIERHIILGCFMDPASQMLSITMAAGGTPFQASQAICFVLKNMLGLICDPVAGLVEVPCVKRNAMGASFALVAADMALAGITSAIPVDQVVDAMYQVGSAMPTAFRETAEGGLAATPKGKALAKEIFG